MFQTCPADPPRHGRQAHAVREEGRSTPLGVPLLTPMSLFSAHDPVDRASHYRMRHMADLFSLILNAWAEVAPGRFDRCAMLGPQCRAAGGRSG